ncbi:hypothetical protein W02_03020 [Nitrospira sp. KM1]|uniref:hypothetical protein n=1 Tax=Nitrospira sp. KM1 TaxID=1936990 RepID=UPI0013A74A13|nr:hypothetical protein [Nitrospira sp. KM1]BCA53162.1 hypothetical protein W02_03020 [Nitrospira sp. KM1]
MGCLVFTDLLQFVEEFKHARPYTERNVIRIAESQHEGFWWYTAAMRMNMTVSFKA